MRIWTQNYSRLTLPLERQKKESFWNSHTMKKKSQQVIHQAFKSHHQTGKQGAPWSPKGWPGRYGQIYNKIKTSAAKFVGPAVMLLRERLTYFQRTLM